ncbi:hypothetical protein QR680_004503 [Steinernema hermaphroditum]|uniref:ShKT domain-containing protein n=1 Tax=Steinernema hermaphroditum TaxID=289476 RepID=A0AA39HR53_9BILA|nr:hypothetical protein QR680_004503 [Steinernema hermaphroditum]
MFLLVLCVLLPVATATSPTISSCNDTSVEVQNATTGDRLECLELENGTLSCPDGMTCHDESKKCVFLADQEEIFCLTTPDGDSFCPNGYRCNLATSICEPSGPPGGGRGRSCADRSRQGRVSDCPQRKHLCKSQLYKELMKKECPRTCGYCDRDNRRPRPNCVDKAAPGRISDCPSRQHLCEDPRYMALMAEQCPRTCDLC